MVTWWYSSSRYLTDGHLFFTVLWLSYRLWWLIPLSYLMMILKNVFHGRMYMLRSAWLWFHESIGGMTISSHLNCFFDGTVLIVAAGRDYKNIILFFFAVPSSFVFRPKMSKTVSSRPVPSRIALGCLRFTPDWKTHTGKHYYETDELSNPRPTQPKKNQVKKWHLWPLFPTQQTYFFVGWDLILQRKQTTRNPNKNKFSANTLFNTRHGKPWIGWRLDGGDFIVLCCLEEKIDGHIMIIFYYPSLNTRF